MSFGYSLLTPKQKERLKKISIICEPDKVVLWIWFYCLSDAKKFEYCEDGPNTLCKSKGSRVTVENSDFSKVFCDDLRPLLTHRKPVFEEIKVVSVGFNNTEEDDVSPDMFETFEDELSVGGLLKTKTLSIEISSIDNLLSILLYLDPTLLKEVDLVLRDESMDINELLELDAWERFEDLELTLTLDTVADENLDVLKETLAYFPYFKGIEIHFDNFLGEDLDDLFGIPVRIDSETVRRVIRTPNKQIVTHHSAHQIKFSCQSGDNIVQIVHHVAEPEPEYGMAARVFKNPVIMKNVVKFTDGIDLASLRKVSHAIRNTIEFLSPDPYINSLSLDSDSINGITVTYNSKSIPYENCQGDCVVWNQFIPEDHRSVFISDFRKMMMNQERALKELNIKFGEDTKTMEMIRNHLRTRDQKMKTEKFKMEISRENEIMGILPHIDPNGLKSIAIHGRYGKVTERILAVDKIMTLDQWRNAKEIVFNGFAISTPIQRIPIDNLVKADLCMNVISEQDLTYLKEKFLHSPTVTRFKISFKQFINNNNANVPWEGLRLDRPETRRYRIPGTNNSLFMMYTVPHSLVFSRLEPALVAGSSSYMI